MQGYLRMLRSPCRSLFSPTLRVPSVRGDMVWPRLAPMPPLRGVSDPLSRLPPPGRGRPDPSPALLLRRAPSPSARSSLACYLPVPLLANACPHRSGRSRTRTTTGRPQAQGSVPPLRVGVPTPEPPSCCRARLRDAPTPALPPVPAVVRWPPPPRPGSTRRASALPPRPSRSLLASRGRIRGRSPASRSATLHLSPPASRGSSRGATPPPPGRLYPLLGRRSPLLPR